MSGRDRITALVCEDEPLARVHLRELVEAHEALDWIGEAADGATAIALIDRLRPALVFLDIRMPEVDGLTVLERTRHRPAVVFTTAYDAHAVQAFELGAVDYLLKPFGADRFATAVARVQRALPAADDAPGESVVARLKEARGPLTRVFVQDKSRIVPVPVREIERLEAEDDYVGLVTRRRRYLLTMTLTTLLDRLDGHRFVRIHRSHAVNLDYVAALVPFDAGRLSVEMHDGTRITASRTGTQLLRAMAG
ncbi:MAG: LytTR family DNA-binding domain-containing protein [Gemmatimonadaceae bacterium]|jgi:two-component system LytT family response regulator|nr:LytTR family DNA-binding domain-containing protein [Gemmatimonadaceae bacterium]